LGAREKSDKSGGKLLSLCMGGGWEEFGIDEPRIMGLKEEAGQ